MVGIFELMKLNKQIMLLFMAEVYFASMLIIMDLFHMSLHAVAQT